MEKLLRVTPGKSLFLFVCWWVLSTILGSILISLVGTGTVGRLQLRDSHPGYICLCTAGVAYNGDSFGRSFACHRYRQESECKDDCYDYACRGCFHTRHEQYRGVE